MIRAALRGGGAGVLLYILIFGGLVATYPHGGHARVFEAILFPYSSLAMDRIGNSTGVVGLLLATSLMQFPFYGAACGVAAAKGRGIFWKTLAAFAAIHLIATVACLIF